MFFIVIIFAIIALCIVGSKALKALREENPDKAKVWGVVALVIVLFVTFLKFVYRIIFPKDDDEESKYSFYILNEDYIFFDNNLPKASFKKGDVVRGILMKADAQTGVAITAAQSPAIQNDYLFIMSAKISIPVSKLRHPTETELAEIQADYDKSIAKA